MSDMQAEMNNGGRWHHIMSDAEVSRALSYREVEIIECPAITSTFILSRRHQTILRAGAMGGDTREVHGGWVYANDIAFQLDRHELIKVAEVVVNRR